MVSQSVSQLIL